MATDAWFELLEPALEKAGILSYFPPVAVAQDVTVLPFGPYKASDGTWKFRTVLRIETSKVSARDLQAATAGSVLFQPSIGDLGTVVLTRGDVVGSALSLAKGALPSWFPKADLVYENVASKEAKAAAIEILKTKGEAARAHARLKKKDPNQKLDSNKLEDELADLWIKGKVPQGLSVVAGAKIGACGEDPKKIGSYFAELRLPLPVTAPYKIFYNPAYLFALWEERGWLKGILPPLLTDTSGPPSGTGKLSFVSGGGSGKISSAVNAAGTGDTILILDAKTYDDALVISRPVSLTSVAAKDDFANYPVLTGGDSKRPITIKSKEAVESGISHIGKLIIEKGLATGSRKDGGGVLVQGSDHVVLSHLWVRRCKAPGDGLFGEGFGGGIAVYHSSPLILSCLVEDNEANARGKGIGVFGYGWPTIVSCKVKNNGLKSLSGRGDGGGIGIEIATSSIEDKWHYFYIKKAKIREEWSSSKLKQAKSRYLRILHCQVISNFAHDDGGGIYVSVMSGVIIRNTTIAYNKAKQDGGGLRLSMGSRLIMEACVLEHNESNRDKIAVDEKGVGGGGISARNAGLLDLRSTKVLDNVAHGWAGGGLYFLSSDEGTNEDAKPILDFDWNDILWDVFDHKAANLHVDAGCAFERNSATKLMGQKKDHGKGGAVYLLRWAGERGSELPLPSDKVMPNGDMKALPLLVEIADVAVLKTVPGVANAASFPKSHRLYLDDQTISKLLDDNELYKLESLGKKQFYYP